MPSYKELRDKSAKQHKISKAKSKRKIHTFETITERNDRLAMHSFYMEKLRNKKRAAQKEKEEKESVIKKKAEKEERETPKKPRKSAAQIILDALERRRKLERNGNEDSGSNSQEMVQSMIELQ